MEILSARPGRARRKLAAILSVALLAPMIVAVVAAPARAITINQPIVGMAATPSGGGYWLVASDGGIFAFGDAQFFGSTGAIRLNQPIVGMAATPSGDGYWLVASDGGIFAFGDAQFFGSTGAIRLNQPIVGMAATPSGDGYWLVASDGGIFAFGDAQFFGSTGAIRLNQPIVGMAATPSGDGYWLVASDGGIFAFGDAQFFGSTGNIRLNQPIVGMALTFFGEGYWLVAADGGIFTFGDAQFFGSTGAIRLNQPIVGMAATFFGEGYWLVASDGGIFAFGDAAWCGSVPGIPFQPGFCPPPGGGPPPGPTGWVDEPFGFATFAATPTATTVDLQGGESSVWHVNNAGGTDGANPYTGTCDGSLGFHVDDAEITPAFPAEPDGAFDNGATLWVKDAIFDATTTADSTLLISGRTLQTRPKVMDGVTVTVQYYVAANTATLRALAVFENPSASAVTPTVSWVSNLGSGPFTVIPHSPPTVTGTSNGDDKFSTLDRWVITSNDDLSPPDPDQEVVTHVLYGPGEALVPFATHGPTGAFMEPLNALTNARVFNCPGDPQGIGVDFSLGIPADGTRALMFFIDLNATNADATQDALRYDAPNSTALGADLLSGLTAGDLARIANWNFSVANFLFTGPGPGGGARARWWSADLSSGFTGFTEFCAFGDCSVAGGGTSIAVGRLGQALATQTVTGEGPKDAGASLVRLWDVSQATGVVTPTVTIAPYPGFGGGVMVATGNLDGASGREVIVGPMPGAEPRINVYRVTTTTVPAESSLFASFLAFEPDFRGGVTVASANIDGAPGDELIVGAGSGHSPRVRIFKFSSAGARTEIDPDDDGLPGFLAYESTFSGGVNVAAGNLDGDSSVVSEIITGRGVGGVSEVRVFSYNSSTGLISQVAGFDAGYVYQSGFLGGVSVGAGDLDADGKAELITGPGPDSATGTQGPVVKVFKLNTAATPWTPTAACPGGCSFLAYNSGFRGGVWVAGLPSG